MKLQERTLKTERYYVFGMPSEEVNQHIRELWGHPNIQSLGIHLHRKTQNVAEWNYAQELAQLIDKDVMEIIDAINIGGGLPSTYTNTNTHVLPGIFAQLQTLRTYLHEQEIQLIIEPGRYIAAPAGKLHTSIILIHKDTIVVDASVYNSDMDALIVPVKLLVQGETTKAKGKPYIIKGRTPCSMDLFRYKVYLHTPKTGAEIVFLNAGAYNFTTDFCHLPIIPTKVIP